MNLVGIGTDWQQVVKGLVLLAAVGFDVWNKRKAGSQVPQKYPTPSTGTAYGDE